MLAVAGELPPAGQDAAWGYEFKWDGVRALAAVRGGRGGGRGRRGARVGDRYPELTQVPDVLAGTDVVVDGEVVALDRLGRPDFGLLQNRLHRTGGAERAPTAGAAPVTYLVFDVLTVAGRSLLDLPYEERRECLDGLGAQGRRWVPTPWFRGGGADVHAASRANGPDGAVAQRRGAPSRPGPVGPRGRRRRARGEPGERPRGRRRQAAGLALPAGRSCAGVAQGQARADAERRRRRGAAGEGAEWRSGAG